MLMGVRKVSVLAAPRRVAAEIDPAPLLPHAWYDPSDITTLFQDAGMTAPVVAANDPVGAVADKSGNGEHLTQSTAANRPLYKTAGGLRWLEFDGSNDALSRTWTMSLAQPWDRVSAWRQIASVTGDDFLFGGSTSVGALYLRSGDLRIYSGTELTGLAAPTLGSDFVATERHDGASSRLAIDNGSYNSGNAGGTSQNTIWLGVTDGGGNLSNARFYGGIIFDRELTDDEVAQLRTYYAAKQGRTL